MWSLLDLVGHGGLIIGVLCVVGAVVALLYVPTPAKHYVVAACLLMAVASQIYAEGYHQATVEWTSKYNTTMAKISSENAQAVITAQQAERQLAAEQQAAINAQVDHLALGRAQDQDEIAQLREYIAKDKTAGDKLNEGLARVIRGVKK